MPPRNPPSNRYASKSYLEDEPEVGALGSAPNPKTPARNVVGDQGVAKLKAKGRGIATPADDQDTPTQVSDKRAAAKKKMEDDNEDLLGRVKKAMTKSGGPLSRSSYDE